jgi:uncharacterized protein (UPF0303 family)
MNTKHLPYPFHAGVNIGHAADNQAAITQKHAGVERFHGIAYAPDQQLQKKRAIPPLQVYFTVSHHDEPAHSMIVHLYLLV